MQVLKAGGIIGTILALIALVMVFIKQLIALISFIIAFIGFLTFAIKAVIVLGFVALILGVGVLIIRSWGSSRRQKDKD
jgi:hypothetical protein